MSARDYLPVPSIGLRCEECRYILNGLPEEVCPECGSEFDVEGMIFESLRTDLAVRDWALRTRLDEIEASAGDDLIEYLVRRTELTPSAASGVVVYLRRYAEDAAEPPTVADAAKLLDGVEEHLNPDVTREAQFSGGELPVPDFGLSCPGCELPMAGWLEHRCPECGRRTSPVDLVPRGSLVTVAADRDAGHVTFARYVLSDNGIPSFIANQNLRAIMGDMSFFSVALRLQVPCELYFDALHVLRQNRIVGGDSEEASEPPEEWTCPQCHESSPGTFEFCWNCGTQRSE